MIAPRGLKLRKQDDELERNQLLARNSADAIVEHLRAIKDWAKFVSKEHSIPLGDEVSELCLTLSCQVGHISFLINLLNIEKVGPFLRHLRTTLKKIKLNDQFFGLKPNQKKYRISEWKFSELKFSDQQEAAIALFEFDQMVSMDTRQSVLQFWEEIEAFLDNNL